ncbi:MAG: hypothetical protein JW803_02990 [Endomicrobiales bacterium]|nr:hypothetical protein [Endomicrobiales bacterium]
MRTFWRVMAVLLIICVVAACSIAPVNLMTKYFYLLAAGILAAFFRLIYGPSKSSRLLSMKVINACVVVICVLYAFFDNKSIYYDIALAWMIQSFIMLVVLEKKIMPKE